MKLYKIFGAMAFLAAAVTSCAVHDPFADKMELGQVLPTVDWEQNSVLVKAGSVATFKAKYYTTGDKQIDHCEVWAMITRSQEATATCKLASSLGYTKSVASSDTVRSSQCMQTYKHSDAVWDGHEYVLTDSFATSRTLAPVIWNSPTEWDQEKFDAYYPAGFQEEFCDYIVNALTKDSTYYNDLRNVYINYDFTKEKFEELNAKYGVSFPTLTESGEKSDAWYTTDEVDHYYYEVVEGGVTVIKEIATPDLAPAGANVYEIYKSSPWLMCRYSDNTGGKITNVRREYMPYWKDLISSIPFTGWIYNTADKNYAVSFSRTYYMLPDFRVYDTDGKVGITSDNKEITLN
ncbi:MAG: hypothetical protein MJZ74_06985 [Muribaculaceae bacterium]|nr:hypothetical protein [Muribaculaceae bacterium]